MGRRRGVGGPRPGGGGQADEDGSSSGDQSSDLPGWRGAGGLESGPGGIRRAGGAQREFVEGRRGVRRGRGRCCRHGVKWWGGRGEHGGPGALACWSAGKLRAWAGLQRTHGATGAGKAAGMLRSRDLVARDAPRAVSRGRRALTSRRHPAALSRPSTRVPEREGGLARGRRIVGTRPVAVLSGERRGHPPHVALHGPSDSAARSTHFP